MVSQQEAITYDEALITSVGQFGPGQMRCLWWTSIPQLANAAAFFLWVFVTVDAVALHAWECTNPADAACQAVWQQQPPSSHDFCALSSQQWQWTSYDSLVAKFNLICGDAWKVQITNSLMFVGAFVGSGLFGLLCDRWGRKRPLFLATALVAAAMYASLAAPSYWVMAALRIITGVGAAGQSHCLFLLATEPIGPSFRGMAGILTLSLFAVGEFLLVALAFALPSWQHITLAAGSINAACLLLYPFVRESGRWLLSRGRTEEATQQLQLLATANKSQMPRQRLVSSRNNTQAPDCTLEAAEEGCSSGAAASSSDGDRSSQQPATMGLCQILGQRRLAVRLLVLLVTWFSLMLNYYGISMGAGGIPGSIYMTFAIGVAAEVLALLIVGPCVDRLGRHNLVALGQLLGGAACLACAMVAGGATQAGLAAVGKFGCAAAEAVIAIYTAELLPTACRSSVLGLCNQASRLGSITAPFLLMAGAQLGSVGGYSQVFVSFLVFGCLALFSGLLMLLMPETLGAAMPESMQDLEQLLSAFTARPWRQGLSHTITFLFRTRAASARGAATTAPAAAAICSRQPTTDTYIAPAAADAAVHVHIQLKPGSGKRPDTDTCRATDDSSAHGSGNGGSGDVAGPAVTKPNDE